MTLNEPSAWFWRGFSPVKPYSGQPLNVTWPSILPNFPRILTPRATTGMPRTGGQMAAHGPVQVAGLPRVSPLKVYTTEPPALHEHQTPDAIEMLRPEHDRDVGDRPRRAERRGRTRQGPCQQRR
jgi:hypothetical protein